MTDHAKNDDLRTDDASVDQIHDETTDADVPLDDESMAAIRAMLEDDAPAAVVAPTPRAQAAAQAVTAPQAAPVEAPAEKARSSRRTLPPIAAAPEATVASKKSARPSRVAGLLNRLTSPVLVRVKGYRPTPKHMIFAALGLLVFFRPWLVVGIVLLSLMVFTGIFLILGYDGFWKRGMAIARWYAQRSPDRAAEMHGRLDRFAMKWDAVLDKFPDGTVDGLYLPDFQELAAAEDRHAAALDRRLNDMRETEA